MTLRIVTAIILSLTVAALIACSGAPASPAPADPTPIVEPTVPSQPATPVVPAEPAAPANPVAPSEPAAPVEPTAPAKPADPVMPDAPSIATVTGTVAYRERIALTPDAVVEIKLIDVSRMDASAVTIGEQIIDNPGQVPIAFEIEYDPAKIDERFSYAIQARITEDGRLAFINDTRYSVITRGSPTSVDMVLVKVASSPTEPTSSSTATVTGTVAYRERIALTPDAIVEVKLVDVSRADAPSITLGENVIDNPGQVPIAFEIEYDPAKIDERFSYAIQARITDGGRLAFINDTRYSVITRGNPTNVDMVLVRVASAPPEAPAVDGPAMTETPAPIESVKLTHSDSTSREYTLHIVSGLPGGCVEFGEYAVSREGTTLDVTVTNLAPTAPVPCTMIYGRHEGEIALGNDFTPGETYAIAVNGTLTNAFTPLDPTSPKAAIAESPIESIDVATSETNPAEYTLEVVSRLPKGSSCSWFNGYDISRPYAGVIEVTVTHFEVTGMMPCTADLPVVTTEMPLGTDFTPGEAVRVTVNDTTISSFTVGDPEGPQAVIAISPIEHIEVVGSESEPTAYTLNVISRLPKGSSCSWFNGYNVSRPYGGVIEVTVTHFEVTGMMPCTADLPVVETEIPLGNGFTAGETYTVNVNDELSETFVA